MKILLLGANGQVGLALRQPLAQIGELIQACRDGDLGNGLTGEIADLGNPQSLVAMLNRVAPDVIVNAAAYTAVDRAEDDEETARVVNAEALAVIGQWAARTGSFVVHYSTDYVFNGQTQQPYLEDDATDPPGAYGRSKLAGEVALRESGAAHFIFRTAWVYAAQGNNFLRTMLRLGAEREELRVVADQIGAPTSAAMIASATTAALTFWSAASNDARNELSGTYHLVASGQTSWHGFATRLFESAIVHGVIARAPTVTAIATADFPTRARRPAYSVLNNSRFQKTFGFSLPAWQQGLDAVMLDVAKIR